MRADMRHKAAPCSWPELHGHLLSPYSHPLTGYMSVIPNSHQLGNGSQAPGYMSVIPNSHQLGNGSQAPAWAVMPGQLLWTLESPALCRCHAPFCSWIVEACLQVHVVVAAEAAASRHSLRGTRAAAREEAQPQGKQATTMCMWLWRWIQQPASQARGRAPA